jgi:uncharacterized DUF497 family protein
MRFEWDERKRRANLAKHGIDFAALDQMFRIDLLEEDDTSVITERGASKQLVKRTVSLYLSSTIGGVTAA